MEQSRLAQYLGHLLGREVVPTESLRLSSGQQARVAGWLAEQGVQLHDPRTRLSKPFSVVMLLDETDASELLPVGTGISSPLRSTLPPSDNAGEAEIGIDIQKVAELISCDSTKDAKASPEMLSIFTFREISYAQSRASEAETLAGLFAAKEALRKCDGNLLGKKLTEIEILPDGTGRPRYRGFAISISHSGGFAVAVAIKLQRQVSTRPIEHHEGSMQREPSHQAIPHRPAVDVMFRVITLAGSLVAFALAFERIRMMAGG